MFILGNEANVFRSLPSLNNDPQSSDNLNSSSSSINTLLPLPDWQQATHLWKSGWPIHIYGFSLLFLCVSLFCLFLIVRYRQRLYRLKAVLNICVLLCIGGTLRVSYLSVDPYGSRHIFSPVVSGVLSQLIYPLLCASYGVIQIMLLRLTRLDVGSSKLRKTSPLLASTLTYLFSIVLIEVIVYCENKAKLLLIVDNGFFVVFALYLCISFICNGFRLSQYASETNRVRKQFELFNTDRKTQPTISVSKSSTSLRLARPRLKITDRDQMTIAIASNTDTTPSDDDNNDLNVRVRKRRHKKSRNGKIERSISGTRSEMLDSTGLISDESGLYGISDTSGVLDLHVSLTSTPLTRDIDQLSKSDDILSCPNLLEHSTLNYSSAENNLYCDKTIQCPAANNEPFPEENGYMADTEIVLNSPKRSDRHCTQSNQEVDCLDYCDRYNVLCDNFRSRTSFISLYRIRQGYMLQKVIQITYCTTFLFLFAVLLQLYTVFGVYGVLNTRHNPDPWPWFTFQTLFRLTELAICTCLMATVYIVLTYRTTTRKRRKPMESDSKNCVV